MEVLNLHLTGDMHAITAANNLLAAMIDNHIYQGNALGIDVHDVTWRRVADVNDRALRNIVIGLGGRADGTPRQTGFDITAASEVMATLALCSSLADLRQRLGRIVVGYTPDGTPVTAEQLHGAGSMAVLLRDAVKPNLLQTLENTPVLVHTGPFGNIATGNSSVIADLIGIHTGDFLVTEAGFGADMGAERFFNIKCRASGLRPDAAVIVVTVRALKATPASTRLSQGGRCPNPCWRKTPPTWPTVPPTCASRSTTSGCTECLQWWRSTPSPPTTRRSTRRSRRSPPATAPGRWCALISPTGRRGRRAGRSCR